MKASFFQTQQFKIYYFPDFNPDSVAKVLELINSGATDLSPDEVQLRTGMISIIQSLQIDINLPVTSENNPMTSQKLTNLSDQHKNLDDLTDNIEMYTQEECGKIQMMTETAGQTKPYK